MFGFRVVLGVFKGLGVYGFRNPDYLEVQDNYAQDNTVVLTQL